MIRLRSAFLVDGIQLSELLFGVHGQLLEDPFLLGIETSDGGIGEEVDLLVECFVVCISFIDFGLLFFLFCGVSVIIGRWINESILKVFWIYWIWFWSSGSPLNLRLSQEILYFVSLK